MPRLLLLLAVTLVTAAPSLAQSPATPRAEMNAQIAALCDGETDCMDTVRQRLQAHCGQDRACMRSALQTAKQRHGESTPTLSDLPEAVQDIVRALLALDQSRGASGGSSASGGTLPAAAVAQLEALPQRRQDRIRQRCGTDPDCIRDALAQAEDRRAQNEQGGSTAPPEAEPETTPEASGAGTRPLPERRTPQGTSGGITTRPDPATGASGGTSFPSRAGTSLGDRETPPEVSGAGTPTIQQDLPLITTVVQVPEGEDGPIVYGAGRTTWVSGNKDEHTRTIMAPEGGWLVGVRMSEMLDDPCELDAYFATEAFITSRDKGDHIDGDGTSEGLAKHFRECGEMGGNPASAHLLAFSKTSFVTKDYPFAFASDGNSSVPYAIDGLQVCQRSSNDLVKGLHLYAQHLYFDETPVETSQFMKTVQDLPSASEIANGALPGTKEIRNELEFERPNCNSWREDRTCPAGQVATGLDIHYDDHSGRARITGLALHCAVLTR